MVLIVGVGGACGYVDGSEGSCVLHPSGYQLLTSHSMNSHIDEAGWYKQVGSLVAEQRCSTVHYRHYRTRKTAQTCFSDCARGRKRQEQ